MSKQQKTKKGMASIYVVVFVTMLIGVITLSFLKIMLSETGRTEKTTLADSALNSAMAGVEDAKTLWIKYQQCMNDIHSYSDCDDVIERVRNSGEGNCDLGTAAKDEHSVGIPGEVDNGDVTDQAYTCVSLSIKGNYKGYLNQDQPVLVIPLRAEIDANNIAGVNISWNTDKGTGTDVSNIRDKQYSGEVNNRNINEGVLGKKGVNSDSDYLKQNGLKVTLIQSGNSYNIDSFYAADASNEQTNRGTVMLLPAADGVTEASKDAFADSADKTYNAPIASHCTNELCTMKLYFPQAIGGYRIQNTFFLVVSAVYSQPDVDSVTVSMFDNDGNNVDFYNVQPIVDSTGRAGNLFRRVEVRLGADAGQLVPLSELTVDGDLSKELFVTKNCVNGTTACDKK